MLWQHSRCIIILRALPGRSHIVAVPALCGTCHALAGTLIVHFGDVVVRDELPAVLTNVVEVDRVTREGVTMTGCVDATAAKLLSFGIGEIPMITLVEDTIGKGRTRADGEEIALEASSIAVDVEQGRSLG